MRRLGVGHPRARRLEAIGAAGLVGPPRGFEIDGHVLPASELVAELVAGRRVVRFHVRRIALAPRGWDAAA